jgi:hypothetical protein
MRHGTLVVDVHVQAVHTEVLCHHGARSDDAALLGQVLLAESLSGSVSGGANGLDRGPGGSMYSFVRLGIVERLADELVSPLLVFGVA